MNNASPVTLLGVDFTCAPGRRKPITVARGQRQGSVLRLERMNVQTLGMLKKLVNAVKKTSSEGAK